MSRRVHMNVPHSANPKPSWYGESVGHYEGDTLVVDTIGLNAKTFVDNYRTPHTEKLHVVERWRLIEGGNRLEVQVTVTDPDTFNQPWQAIRRYEKGQGAFPEEICAENNHNLFGDDYDIPESDSPTSRNMSDRLSSPVYGRCRACATEGATRRCPRSAGRGARRCSRTVPPSHRDRSR